jgi:NADH-quinone oxidoreductase subunit L
MRQITLTFLGEPRSKAAAHASETTWTMTLPLVVLAVFAVGAGWAGIPATFPLLGGVIPNWFEEFVIGVGFPQGHAAAAHASLIPLLTSLVVSLGGLYLGWTTYRGIKAGAPDPLKRPLGGVYTLLKNKYYVDEIYDVAFVRPARWLADTFTSLWMDRTVIDGFLHAIARAALWLGNVFRNFFDVPVVNGAGDGTGWLVRSFGFALKVVQTGRVQQYLVTALLVMAAVAAIVVTRFLVQVP